MPPLHPARPTVAGIGRGARVRLTEVGGQPSQRLRLAELGIRTGALVTVLGRTAGGGRVLAIGTSRVALDRHTAARLLVETQ